MKLNIKLTLIGISIALGVASALYMYNKPRKDIASKKPDHKISAVSLAEEYSSNEEIANEKYLGKVLEVQGRVASYEQGKNPVITLEGSGLGNIRAEMGPEFRQKIDAGQPIKLKGMCTGFLLDVVLTECTIIENK